MSEAYIRNHIADIVNYANVIEKRLDDEIDIERLIECSKGFKEDCDEYCVPNYVIDEAFCLDDILKFCGDAL